MNEEPQVKEQPIQVETADAQPKPAAPVIPEPQSSSRRLRELLAVPERERTDAVWDEIISLEIQLAPGNRAPSPQALMNGGQQPGGQQHPGRNGDPSQRRGPQSGAKSAKRFSNKSKRGPRRPPKP